MIESNETNLKQKELINYWPFDNDLNDVVSGKNMIMGESASFSDDRNSNPASALDLSFGYVQAQEGFYFNGDFTITVWIMMRNSTFKSKILDFCATKGTDEVIWGLSANARSLEFSILNNINDKTTHFDFSFISNKWYFLSLTLEKSISKIYINGALNHSGQNQIPRNRLLKKNYIGKSNWNDFNANMKVDELKIFNGALNQTEITEEMQKDMIISKSGRK